MKDLKLNELLAIEPTTELEKKLEEANASKTA